MKARKFYRIIITILIFIVLALVIANIYFYARSYQDKYKKEVENSITTEADLYKQCNQFGLVNISYCLWKNIEKIYKFNMSNAGKELTFDELLKQGGVCSHYTNVYINNGEKLGLIGKEIVVEMNNSKSKHVYAMLSNKEGYCILDGNLKPFCVNVELE